MPRLLAAEWDVGEARFVVASLRGRSVTIEQLGQVPLSPPDGEGASASAELHQEVASAAFPKASRAKVLVGLSRANVELRQLTMPPAPDTELPELVRMQALREQGFVNEESLLDFIPLAEDPTEARAVVAAAISRDQYAAINAMCTAAGIKPDRLLLRPYAAASLFLRQAANPDQAVLLIDVSLHRADLTVVIDRRVVLSRTVRLPSDDETAALPLGPLLAEVRRSLIAVENQPGGGSIEAIYVFGTAREHQALVEALESELRMPAQAFDPFAGVSLKSKVQSALPAETGRFASLVGMLLDEAHGSHALDLLNPRRKPEPINRKRLAVAAAALIAAVGLTLGYTAWTKFDEINDDIERLSRESRELDNLLKVAEAKRKAVEEINQWAGGEVIWLDELRDLSLRFPSPRDAVLLGLTMSRSSSNKGGVMEFQGLVRDPSIVGRMESALRDDHHEVRSKRVQASIQDRIYTWQFESSLSVTKRDKELYQTTFPREAPPATAALSTPAEAASGATPPAATNSDAAPGTESTSPASPEAEQPAAAVETVSETNADNRPRGEGGSP